MSQHRYRARSELDRYAEKAQAGDERAFELLREALEPMIARLCHRYRGLLEYEDARSVANFALLSCLESWRADAGAEFGSFFAFRLRSRLIDAQPARRETPIGLHPRVASVDRVEPSKWHAVVAAYEHISDKDKAIIRMVAEGSSSREIAKQIGMSPEYVRQRIVRFRQQAYVHLVRK